MIKYYSKLKKAKDSLGIFHNHKNEYFIYYQVIKSDAKTSKSNNFMLAFIHK